MGYDKVSWFCAKKLKEIKVVYINPLDKSVYIGYLNGCILGFIIKMENKYYVQIKGIKENENCWRTVGSFNKLDLAMNRYELYISGCCKRIVIVRNIIEKKIIKYKEF